MIAVTLELKRSTALTEARIFRNHDHTMSLIVPHEIDEFLDKPEFVTVLVKGGTIAVEPDNQ